MRSGLKIKITAATQVKAKKTDVYVVKANKENSCNYKVKANGTTADVVKDKLHNCNKGQSKLHMQLQLRSRLKATAATEVKAI